MIIKVDKNFINFDNDTLVNKKEYNVTPLKFEFSKEYDGLTCKAIFSNISDGGTTYYQEPIINNECKIPYEVLDSDIIVIGVYAYDIKEGELILRYSPSPKKLVLLEGSYYDGASTPEEISPSQFEQYTSYLNGEIAKLNQINISTNKISNGVRINITNSNGVTTHTDIYNGEKGDKGDPGATGATGAPGRDGYVQYTAGSNITITDGVISATNTTYSAGNNININSENVISADLSSKQDIIQYSTMPTASSSNEGKIVQFIGTTDSTYTNGYFYQCVSDEEETPTYSWENIQVQTGGSVTQNIPIWECTSGSTYDFVPANISGYNIEYNKWYIAGNDFKAKASVYNNLFELVGKGDLFKIVNPNTSNTYYGFIHLGCGGTGQYYTNSPFISIWKKGNTSISDLVSTKSLLNNYNLFGTLSSSNTSGTDATALPVNNTRAYTPTANYHPATKKYVDDKLTSLSGYDATKTQILKNVNGTLTWVDE